MSSITHDEADYFLNGWFLAKTGSDVWNNKLFLTSGIIRATGGIPVYLNALFFRFLDLNILNSRLPYFLVSIFIPLFFYKIIKKITKNKNFSLTAFFVFNFSPWFLYNSTQAGVEQIPSLFFLIAGFYFYLQNNFLSKIISLLSFFFSYFSYMGIKISFPFLLISLFLTKLIIEKQKLNFKNLTILILKIFLINLFFLTFLVLENKNNFISSRANENLIFLNKPLIENRVWYERLTFEGPEILKKISSNKLTVIINHLVNNFFSSIDPKILFLKGDPHSIYGNNLYGLFYLWQIIFLIYGIIKIKNLPKFEKIWPLLLIIVFGSIPTMISTIEVTIALRSFPIIIPYSLLIANGLYQFFEDLKVKKNLYLPIIIFFFILSSFHFFFVYQTRIKVLSSEQWHLGEKKLFEKLKKDNFKEKILILNNEPKETFMLFSFYQLTDAKLVKEKIQKQDYSYKNLYFYKLCPLPKKIGSNILIIKRGFCNIDDLVSNKKINYQIYLDSSDKSGTLYYLIKNYL